MQHGLRIKNPAWMPKQKLGRQKLTPNELDKIVEFISRRYEQGYLITHSRVLGMSRQFINKRLAKRELNKRQASQIITALIKANVITHGDNSYHGYSGHVHTSPLHHVK